MKIVRLGDAFKTTSGGTPSRRNANYYRGEIPWVKSGELKSNIILDTEEKISAEAVINSSAKVFPKGTLLIALYGATIGKLAWLGIDATTNQAVCGIFNNEDHDLRYLYWYLFHKRKKLIEAGIGGAQPNISQTILKNLEVPLPKKQQQQQLVSKIEELFSEVDKGIEEIKTAQQQLKVYRQAVLKWAFGGKLTNKDVKEGELPKGWQIEKLGSISEMCLGKMLDKQKNKGVQMPYLGNINVRWGDFQLNDLKQMRFENDEVERFSLKKGDLVICEGGEPGRCAIWKSDNSSMMIQKALHRVRVSSAVDVKYVYHFLFYSATNGTLTKYFTGTTIKHLTGKELKKIEFPMPLPDEQQQIVQEIESRLSVCDKLEETITNSLKQAEPLRQSILKKAFEGKLL
jgi:type I restriction enzyme S subunit